MKEIKNLFENLRLRDAKKAGSQYLPFVLDWDLPSVVDPISTVSTSSDLILTSSHLPCPVQFPSESGKYSVSRPTHYKTRGTEAVGSRLSVHEGTEQVQWKQLSQSYWQITWAIKYRTPLSSGKICLRPIPWRCFGTPSMFVWIDNWIFTFFDNAGLSLGDRVGVWWWDVYRCCRGFLSSSARGGTY